MSTKSDLTSQIQKNKIEFFEIEKKKIEKWLKENTIIYGTYHINDNLTIDIDGGISKDISGGIGINLNVTNFPYKFNIINGYFHCYFCRKLKSLHNSPDIVKGRFDFSHTNINSYEERPREISEDLWGNYTKIKSMKSWLNKIKMNPDAAIHDNKHLKGIKYKDYIKENFV